MYSGTTLTKFSGCILGAHQKIDRVARKHLAQILPQRDNFPTTRQILHFEGKNGPDAIKRKSPAHDEPWHYYTPFDTKDAPILILIRDHYNSLIECLKQNDQERAAFEAAWLAHALVDGLTPAHHYPYEQKLVELREGKSIDTRTSIREKIVMHGKNRREKLINNWKMWGARGLLMTHWWFEIGISTIIMPLNFRAAMPSEEDVEKIRRIGIIEWFKQSAQDIATLNIYERYYRRGWTTQLAQQIRQELAPLIVKTVTLTWYMAAVDGKDAKL
ncbi:MAG: hypothetical protein ABSB12_03170 [Candidatus Saccharimonadales bacterium]